MQHGDAEESLRERGVRAGNCGRKEEQDGEAAENPLRDDGAESRRRPRSCSQRRFSARQVQTARMMVQKADELGDHAMAVFELHAADHVGHFVEGAEGGGPVRDGETGVIAGDERAGNDQEKRDARP